MSSNETAYLISPFVGAFAATAAYDGKVDVTLRLASAAVYLAAQKFLEGGLEKGMKPGMITGIVQGGTPVAAAFAFLVYTGASYTEAMFISGGCFLAQKTLGKIVT